MLELPQIGKRSTRPAYLDHISSKSSKSNAAPILGRRAVPPSPRVCHRTVWSEECFSSKTAVATIFKFAKASEKSWRRLDDQNQLPKVILGVTFTDGIEVVRSQAQAAAA
jgi:hypothetical protein